MKNYWVAGLLNALLIFVFIFLFSFIITLVSYAFPKPSANLIGPIIITCIVAGTIVILSLSNWISSRFILKEKLIISSAWKFSFVSGGYFGLASILISFIENKPFSGGGYKIGYFIGIILGTGLLVGFLALLNYCGILLANRVFGIQLPGDLSGEVYEDTLDSE